MTSHNEKPTEVELLLAAAGQATAAASDMIEAARDGEITEFDNVGSGDTLTILVDGLRLLLEAIGPELIEAMGPAKDTNQLHGALVRFLDQSVRGRST